MKAEELVLVTMCRCATVVLLLITLSGSSRCQDACAGDDCKTDSSTDMSCELPPPPIHGSYVIANLTDSDDNITSVAEGTSLQFTCDDHFFIYGDDTATCFNETWTTFPICKSPNVPYIIGGSFAKYRQFPWAAAIYYKGESGIEFPEQICGGTILNSHTIITAAHCFYIGSIEEPLSKEFFTIVADKLHRNWYDGRDRDAQFSEIKELHIPEVYADLEGNYADDIAVIILKSPLNLRNYKRIDIEWSHTGLEVIPPGSIGWVAGWGLTEENGNPSDGLKYITLPAVPRTICKEHSPRDFRKFLTHDKFCAGYLNGSSVCKGDSGSGFIFKREEDGQLKHYLRGVVSVGPPKDGSCDSHKFTAFTSVIRHLDWLKSVIVEDTLPEKKVNPIVTYFVYNDSSVTTVDID